MIRKKPLTDDDVKVTFILPDDHPHGRDVSVVGDFNDWDSTANPFVRRSNKTYSTSAVLGTGQRYVFRYCCGDGSWINDPDADGYEPNDFGSDNAVLLT